jgi:exosortase
MANGALMGTSRRTLWIVAALISLVAAYRNVLIWLIDDWNLDGNYSHGWLVVPISLYLAWERRDRLRAAARRPSLWGLALLVGSLLLLAAGTVAAETFSTRVSLIGVLVGIIWFVAGREQLKVLWFPLAFLLLMIPIPMIIFNRVSFPLQLIASEFGGRSLSLVGIPVFREGNLIELEHMSLNVAEACSGIRSLVSLFTLTVLYGYFTTPSRLTRVALAIATVPIAIVANGMRVASTGIAVHFVGPQAAEGFFHEASGSVVFIVAAGGVVLLRLLADWCWRRFGGLAVVPAMTREAA